MPITIDGTNGITQAGEFNSDSSFGFKNRIINGGMVIDQRNAGASVTPANATGTYTLDRWRAFENTDGVISVQQDSSAPTGFTNSLKITISTADSSLAASQQTKIQQNIEGFNVADLGWGTADAKTVTLSFWVRSSVTGTFGGGIQNSDTNRSYPFTYTISVADTWEQKTITIAGDTTGTWLKNNGIGINVTLSLGAGTDFSGTAGAWNGNNNNNATGATNLMATLNATWQVTGVQLEVGSTATSFDYRPYGTELALCQRYYWKTLGAGNESIGIAGYGVASNAFWAQFTLPVTMRASPTVTVYGTWAVSNTGQPTIRAASASNFLLQTIPTSTAAVAVYPNSSDDYIDASIEL